MPSSLKRLSKLGLVDKRLSDLFDAWYSSNVDDPRDVFEHVNKFGGGIQDLSKQTGLSIYEVLDRLKPRYKEYYKKRLKEDLKKGRAL